MGRNSSCRLSTFKLVHACSLLGRGSEAARFSRSCPGQVMTGWEGTFLDMLAEDSIPTMVKMELLTLDYVEMPGKAFDWLENQFKGFPYLWLSADSGALNLPSPYAATRERFMASWAGSLDDFRSQYGWLGGANETERFWGIFLEKFASWARHEGGEAWAFLLSSLKEESLDDMLDRIDGAGPKCSCPPSQINSFWGVGCTCEARGKTTHDGWEVLRQACSKKT
jgi:hypothetical protein